MEIIESFILEGNNHPVQVLNDDGIILFRASDVGTIFKLANIHTSLTGFDNDEKVIRSTETEFGTQECIYLTEPGLYRFIMTSRKPIATPFKKWVCKVITTIRQTGVYKLEGDLRTAIQQEALLSRDAFNLTRHEGLIDMYRGPNTYVVYIALLKYVFGKLLIKIGCTKHIGNRAQQLEAEFGYVRFMYVFPCSENERFEKYLHHHKSISQFAYKEAVYEGRTSNEVFLVTEDTLDTILNIIKHNRVRFNNTDNADKALEAQRLALEHDRIKLEHLRIQNEMRRQQQIATTLTNPLPNPIVPDLDPIIISNIALTEKVRSYKQSRGPKIQRYSPDGIELLQTYIGHTDALRDPLLKQSSRCGLSEAITKCTVYKGFRWATLDRELEDTTVQTLEPTVNQAEVRLGLVAMLNLDKTQIIKVFKDQKDAAVDRQFSSPASISAAIRFGRKSGGHYFVMYDDCDSELQHAFLKANVLPEQTKRINSRQVDQLHPITNHVIQTFASVAAIQKEMHTSRLTLSKAIDDGTLLKGFRWRIATT